MAFIWRRCDGAHGLDAFLAGLQEEFDGVPAEAAGADVRRALEELLTLGLVTTAAGTAG
jgi:hypothetical protein